MIDSNDELLKKTSGTLKNMQKYVNEKTNSRNTKMYGEIINCNPLTFISITFRFPIESQINARIRLRIFRIIIILYTLGHYTIKSIVLLCVCVFELLDTCLTYRICAYFFLSRIDSTHSATERSNVHLLF